MPSVFDQDLLSLLGEDPDLLHPSPLTLADPSILASCLLFLMMHSELSHT